MSADGVTMAPSIGNPYKYQERTSTVRAGRLRHVTTPSVPTYAQTASLFITRTTRATLPLSTLAPTPVVSYTTKPEMCLTCQKGVCQVVAGVWACTCYVGFTGDNCEIRMRLIVNLIMNLCLDELGIIKAIVCPLWIS